MATTMDPVETRDSLREQIAALDEKLDTWSDAGAAGKRRLTNDLISEREDSWSKVSNALIEQLNGLPDDRERIGSYLGFMKALRDTFQKSADEYLDALVESQPKSDSPDVSDEEKKAVAEERSELFQNFKKLRDLLLSFKMIEDDDEDWNLPKARRANVGKRGKRALTLMTWFIDGEPVDDESDSPRGVAALLGFEKAADFTQALKDAGVNTTKPGEGFTAVINGKTIEAQLDTGGDDEDEDEDEDTEEGED